MLPKKNRFNAGNRLQSAQSFSTPFFILKCAKNNKPYNRYGIIISKKVDAKAANRNKIKRAIMHCIQESQHKGAGWDMLFIVKKESVLATKEILRKAVEETIKKV